MGVLSVMLLAGHKHLGTTTQDMADGYRASERLVRGTGIRTGYRSGHTSDALDDVDHRKSS
ncbi:MAG: hypothetical protein DRJ42_13825 [Deltaproteobacteria bacterium]|nr:MAG: hypothetical protein DRJ42_13825 [Deltaproteobacteria bacterium]